MDSRKFMCPKCPAGLSTQASLARHLKEVHEPKRHTCPICPYEAHRNDDIYRHVKARHDADDVQYYLKIGSTKTPRGHHSRTPAQRTSLHEQRRELEQLKTRKRAIEEYDPLNSALSPVVKNKASKYIPSFKPPNNYTQTQPQMPSELTLFGHISESSSSSTEEGKPHTSSTPENKEHGRDNAKSQSPKPLTPPNQTKSVIDENYRPPQPQSSAASTKIKNNVEETDSIIIMEDKEAPGPSDAPAVVIKTFKHAETQTSSDNSWMYTHNFLASLWTGKI